MATTSNTWRDDLIEQIMKASIKAPETRNEVVDWYQAQYPGNIRKRGATMPLWQEKLVNALADLTGGKYKRDSLMRRFQKRAGKDWRDKKPSKAAAAEYKALGALIGPRPPQYGYHISVNPGWIRFSRDCEKRVFTVNIVNFAAEVAWLPTLAENAILLIYMEEDNLDEKISDQSPSVGFCDGGDEGAADPKIIVTALHSPAKQGHSGEARKENKKRLLFR